LLTRKYQIAAADVAGAERVKPPKVFVWTKESNWVNGGVFREMLSAITPLALDAVGQAA